MTDLHSESEFYIPARTSLDFDATTRLKHGDTFAVFHSSGDCLGFEGSTDGVYHKDTRHLSHFELRLAGARPLLLSSAMQNDNAALVVDLTNPDYLENGKVVLAKDMLHVQRTRFVWKAAVFERLVIRNYDAETRQLLLSLTFGADFADLFEARGQKRSQRGSAVPPVVGKASVELGYRGLDSITRRTRLSFWPEPDRLNGTSALVSCVMPPGSQHVVMLKIDCEPPNEPTPFEPPALLSAMVSSRRDLAKTLRRAPTVWTSSEHCNEILMRARVDLAMLITHTPYGPYPYAGIPWFSTYFGRDALITSLFTLWLDPQIARGVLGFLAANQAREIDAFRDAEPGKILHEVRQGEMAALREVPFGLYYGSINSTPLFVLLAGEYFRRTGDLRFLDGIWPSIKAALEWIEHYGDIDGDGFVEYSRRSSTGLQNQGWKDSHNSISHENGELADGPIALCEVQAYVYGAWLAAAALASSLADPSAAEYRLKADALKAKFDEAFWLADLNTYALALDGRKRPCRVIASNAGHVLFTGLALDERAKEVADTLLASHSFSDWGIRTLSTTAKRYNPMSYHNGSVWPHDNALAALGFSRYGLKESAARVFEGLAAAARYLPLQRLPELFCGFSQRKRGGPTGYPVACSPQAWAAATPLALLSACLDLRIDFASDDPVKVAPLLPRLLESVILQGLKAGSVDFTVRADRKSFSVRRAREDGGARVA